MHLQACGIVVLLGTFECARCDCGVAPPQACLPQLQMAVAEGAQRDSTCAMLLTRLQPADLPGRRELQRLAQAVSRRACAIIALHVRHGARARQLCLQVAHLATILHAACRPLLLTSDKLCCVILCRLRFAGTTGSWTGLQLAALMVLL